MIRINLLPVKQAKKREYGRQQLALFIFFIFVEIVLLFLVYNSKSEELAEIERSVAEAQTQVAQVQDYQNRITQLEADLHTLEADQRIYDNLQANRIGPGGPLQELMAIMNRWTSERQRAEQEERGWNTDVDPNRVWVDSIDVDPSGFRLRGVARDGEDVAEFLLRLDTARAGEEPFFLHPVLSSYSRTNDAFFGEVMQFSISGGVRYRPVAVGSN